MHAVALVISQTQIIVGAERACEYANMLFISKMRCLGARARQDCSASNKNVEVASSRSRGVQCLGSTSG